MRPAKTAKALLALWLSLTVPGLAETENRQAALHLGLDQAREVAVAALTSGQPRLAFSLTEGLLKADPQDGHALYVQARALAQLRDFDKGRRSAAKAYRFATTDTQHFESATLAAQLSIAGQRMTHSQLWLRRASHYAPDDRTRGEAIAAFRQARNRNPLNVQLSFSVSPSDNVNNGSNSPLNIIDGVPVSGILSQSAQAISGWTSTLNVQASYRVRETETSETRIVARGLAYHVEFNDPVPGLSASDLASQRLGLGVAHIWKPDDTGFWRFNGDGGRVWYGGDPSYDFLSANVGRVQKLSDRWQLSFGAAVEEQFDDSRPIRDATVWSGNVGLTHLFETGSTITVSALYRETATDFSLRASTQWSGIVRYNHGRQIGPAMLSVSVGHSSVDYYAYSLALLGTTVFRGREDNSWFGEVSATLKSASYMGFVPVVSLRTEQSRSNISRFDVDQTGVSVGIRSEF
ncbi:MAG: surface lipoprotein assembly modifier [Pseudomonadota bacterium]